MNPSGGALRSYSLDEIIPYFIEYPKEKFCSTFSGIIYCYHTPSRYVIGDLDINQFKKIAQVVFKSPVDFIEYRFINIEVQDQRQIYIGSNKDCDISISFPTISEKHAVLNIISPSEMWLTDLKSRFGTQVNERVIYPDIKTPIKINDNINLGLVRSYLKTSSWLYSSIYTRFAMQIKGDFERIVIRYYNGKIIKRLVNSISIDLDRITLKNILTGQFECFSTEGLKAVFWVKNLIGDPSRVDRQGFIREADPSNIFIEFQDGECQWGSQSGYSERAYGFYFYPHDPDSNNIKCYIPRSAVNYVLI